ncbi:MAG TPA: potassium-transporting ATPase subunit C, partial [Ktedonobacterales bacterium]|nr:potassium-transporting ATPase subunit C [Ktedonobacterales bacterium]
MARNARSGGAATQEVTPQTAPEAEAAPERASRTLLRQLRPAIVLTLALTLLLGIGYPLLTTVVAQGLFPSQANGSLVYQNGKPVASRLIGQYWTQAQYFHGRPSVTTNLQGTPAPYQADNSGGSNLGPTNSTLVKTVQQRIAELKKENPDVPAGT